MLSPKSNQQTTLNELNKEREGIETDPIPPDISLAKTDGWR